MAGTDTGCSHRRLQGIELSAGSIIAYMLPKAGQDEGDGDEDRAYAWVREYTYDGRPTEPGTSYTFALCDDGVCRFNELSSRLDLKRRVVTDDTAAELAEMRPQAISVARRDVSGAEAEARERRLQLLGAPAPQQLLTYDAGAPTTEGGAEGPE